MAGLLVIVWRAPFLRHGRRPPSLAGLARYLVYAHERYGRDHDHHGSAQSRGP